MTAPVTARPPWPWKALLVLLLLALLPRLALISAARTNLFRRSGGSQTEQARAPSNGEPHTWIGEEIARGNIAQEILRGPLTPLLDYQYAHFFGGSLVVGILAVPCFAVLGPSVFTLKLVPIGFHLLALLFLFLILDRFVSRRAAWIGGALYALSPPGYTLLSTVAWGSHVESNALAMVCVWLFLDLTQRPAPVHRKRFVFGLLAGFSLYFGYQCALFLAALTLFDLFRDRVFFLRRSFLAQAAGFLIGFSPWIAYNLRNDFAGLAIYGQTVGGHTAGAGGEVLARLSDLLQALPRAMFFPPEGVLPAAAMDYGMTLVLVALVVGAAVCVRSSFAAGFRRLIRRESRSEGPQVAPPPAAIAVAYLGLFVVGFTLSDFRFGVNPDLLATFRYAAPLFPFVVLAAASFLDRLLAADPVRWRPLLALPLAMAAACAVGLLGYMDPGRLGHDWDAPGYSDSGLGGWFLMRYEGDREGQRRVVDAALRRRTHEERERLFFGMGQLLFWFSAERPGMSDAQRAAVPEWTATRDFHHSLVSEPYARYFEPRETWLAPPD